MTEFNKGGKKIKQMVYNYFKYQLTAYSEQHMLAINGPLCRIQLTATEWMND